MFKKNINTEDNLINFFLHKMSVYQQLFNFFSLQPIVISQTLWLNLTFNRQYDFFNKIFIYC